jgi:AAA ATPase domain
MSGTEAAMVFVGRQAETAQIIQELNRKNNVILTGKHGIGRTALLKHLAELNPKHRRFVFADFSQARSEVSRGLFAQLFPKENARRLGEYLAYKWARFRIAKHALPDKREHVLVLDNVARLTHQKLDLIRYLEFEKRFRFVAIVETFLHPDDLFSLRADLIPVSTIKLDSLDDASVEKFFRHYSEQQGWHWSEEEIETLVSSVGGYPLRMAEIVARHMQKRKATWKAPTQRA